MPRFFVEKQNISDDVVVIRGDDAHHISRSLRMAAGEHITVCDMETFQYDCVLEQFRPEEVTARILSVTEISTEPWYRVHLYQALPKGDKLDAIIQKSVECGVFDVTVFESENCVAKSKSDTEAKKSERRQRIALEAAKQSGRGRIPQIYPTVSFDEMLSRAVQADVALFCYEAEKNISLKQALQSALKDCRLAQRGEQGGRSISVIIGSEGGFSSREAEAAVKAGCISVSLGTRILRTETASGFVLGCLSYELEF